MKFRLGLIKLYINIRILIRSAVKVYLQNTKEYKQLLIEYNEIKMPDYFNSPGFNFMG